MERDAFLPLGNDVDTAVYQVVANDVTPYFLKLRSWRRSGRFDATTVTIPRFLHDQGITQIIASIPTRERQLWARLDAFAVILFPFIAGRNGFAAPLSERQWIEFGAALKKVHTVVVPPTLNAQIPYETYAPLWCDRVWALQARAATLGDTLRARSPTYVLCHADIHAANILIGTDGALYIVDWDTLILAPKERDLMFIGGGVGGAWNTTREETLFYRGYSQTEINWVALAYYRFERIVEDIVEFCERLLLTDEGGENRAVGLGKFVRQFGPNNVVEIAYRTDMGL